MNEGCFFDKEGKRDGERGREVREDSIPAWNDLRSIVRQVIKNATCKSLCCRCRKVTEVEMIT